MSEICVTRHASAFHCHDFPALQLWHNRSMNQDSPPPLHTAKRSLRDQVDELLPNWQSWYPSLFDAAYDLGILRARVCDLSSLVLSKRHASVYSEALQAFREQWSVEEPEAHESGHPGDGTSSGSTEQGRQAETDG